MSSLFIVVLLVFIAGLPIVLAWWYFRAKTSVRVSLFLFALLAGLLGVLVAAAIQLFIAPLIPEPAFQPDSRLLIFYKIFVEIALTEETARLLTILVVALPLLKQYKNQPDLRVPLTRTLGLLAGFTFAAVETVFFAMTTMDAGLIRAVSAAPLHGACGIRAGNAVLKLKTAPLFSVFSLFSAAALHGVYNFLVQRNGISPYLGVAIAITAMLAGLQSIALLPKHG
jgi:hypothetical protein